MGLSPLARRRTSWLVLLAFLYATLVPSLGLAGVGGAAARTIWMEICGAAPHQRIAIEIPGESPDDAGRSLTHGGHCLLCFSPSTEPDVRLPILAPPATGFLYLALAAESVLPRGDSWRPSLARAPPHRI